MDSSGHKPGAWTWLLAWVAAGLRRPVRHHRHELEPADMGTAFGLDCTLGAPLYVNSRGDAVDAHDTPRARTVCRPTSAFIPAAVRHRRART